MRKSLTITTIHSIMRRTVASTLLLIIFINLSFAQNRNAVDSGTKRLMSGIVSDNQGTPLAGVSINIKGTVTGTVTDSAGRYRLLVPRNGLVVVSHVGYLSLELPIGNEPRIDISLRTDNQGLNAVVVVGYGTQRKKDLTGSVSTIGGADLQVAPTPDLFNNLAGKLTGVIVTQGSGQPGYDQPEFSIRGKSTFGDNSALVLVDGIERPYAGIDPNDIESITVLKDAASAAVYGARAANGVVLITLKQGRSGKTQISYSGSLGLQKPTVRPKMMNSYQYAKYFNEARVNSGNTAAYTDAEVEKFRLGNDPNYPNTDWWAASVHNSAPIQQNNVTLQGGTDKLNIILSVGNLNQHGLYDLSWFKRTNFRSNINYRITDDLSLMVDLAGRVEETSQSPRDLSGWRYILAGKPTLPAFVPDSVEPGGLGFNGLNGNPLGNFDRSGYDRNTTAFLMSMAELNYRLRWVPGLSLKARLAFDKAFTHEKTFTTPFSYYSYDNLNNIYQLQTSSAVPTLNEIRGDSTQTTFQFSVNYNRKLGAHTLSGLLLYEQVDVAASDISAYREGFLSPTIDQIFAGGNLNKTNGGLASQTARQGYVGRVNYAFAEKYLFQANFRYDGSYNFSPGRRWGFFPAVSAGWRVSEESFMKKLSFLSNMKIRASYGQFGNDRISPFQFLTGYVFSQGYITGTTYNTGIVDAGLANPNVTWETATNRDIGLDLGFLNGKLESEMTYFYKRTKNILLPRSQSVPATFGATLPDENIGIVDNSGFEFLLRHKNRIGKFSYTVEGNLTYAKSKVIYMDEPENVPDRLKQTGHPFDQTFGLVSRGFFTSQQEINAWPDQDGQHNASLKPGDIKYLDLNKDGVIDGSDIKQIGKSGTPQLVFGFNLNLDYNGFGLIANFQGATGFNRYLLLDPFQLDQNALAVNANAWRPDNLNAAYPRLTNGLPPNNNLVSSQWMVDNTYMRLKNAEIYYTIPGAASGKIGIKYIRVFVSGNNVLTFSKRSFVDPELLSIAAGDVIYYPHLKSYNFGLNVNF